MRKPDKIVRSSGLVRYQARYQVNGHYKCKLFRTYKEAEKFLRDIADRQDSGVPINTDMTLEQLAAIFRRSYVATRKRQSTRDDYEEQIARLLNSATAAGIKRFRLLRAITPQMIEEFREAELTAIRARLKARGSSKADTAGIRSVNKAVAVLRKMLHMACGRQYIGFNAAEHVEPLARPHAQDEAVDANVLSYAQLQQLLNGKDDAGKPFVHPDWLAAFMVLAFGGLRLGELLGLRWQSVDLTKNRIRVEQQLEASTGELSGLKTKAAKRWVELPSFVVHELRVWKARQPLEARTLDLCFANEKGNPYGPDNFRHRIFRPALKKAGLPPIRIHDMRHTAASMMIATGADLPKISRQLGHANISITLAVYGHQLEERNPASLGSMVEKLWNREVG